MAEFCTSTILPINNVSISSGTSINSEWYDVRVADGFNLWYYMTSSGSPNTTISALVSLFDCANSTTAPSGPVSGGTNYRTITWTATGNTKAAWTHVDTPAEIANYPIKWIKFNVAADTADVTGFYLAVGKNGI